MISRHCNIIIICVTLTRARCSRALVVRGGDVPYIILYNMSVSYYNIHSPHVAVAVVAHANRIVAGVYYYYFHAGRGFVMVDGEIRSSNRELLRPGGRPSIKSQRKLAWNIILYILLLLYYIISFQRKRDRVYYRMGHGTWNMVTTTSAHKSYHTTNVIIKYCARMGE